MSETGIEEIAALIALLRPAPAAWVEAAQSLPALERELEPLVEQWREDATARAAALADLERALSDEGVAPADDVLRYVRLLLDAPGS